MDDIRLFIKKNAKDKILLSINYLDTHNTYNYKYLGIPFQFKEYLPENIDEDGKIEMIINNKTLDNFIDIQLTLFDLFKYKTIDYIDIYIQKKIYLTKLIISDLYDDYYDDRQKKLICTRRFTLDGKEIIKLKFVAIENDITLYYQMESINDFDNIIKKIDEIMNSYLISSK